MAKKSGVNTSELGSAVRSSPRRAGLSLRDVAELTGVSASTLSRLRTERVSLTLTTSRVLASWLDMPIERVMHHGHRSPTDPKPVVYYPHESTLKFVEAHLRADKHLTADTAKALSELFRVAYAQFSQNPRKRG